MVRKSLAVAAALSLVLSSAALAQTGTSGGTEGAGTPPAAAQTNSTKQGMQPGTSAAPGQMNADSPSGAKNGMDGMGHGSGGGDSSGSSGH